MTFFAPLFLLGALAVAGPIIFHLIRRTTREVTPFSSLMFLQPTPPRVTRRSRLENLWLLLLRCLALALLALGFARPYLQQPRAPAALPTDSGKRLILVIDTSASMRRENLWAQARRKADETLRAARPGDEVAVIAFDAAARTVLTFEEWTSLPIAEGTAMGSARIGALAPGWGGTQLDRALINAAELLENASDAATRPGEIMLISDLQEGCRLDALQGYDWPRNVRVVLAGVEARRLGNASAQWIMGEEPPVGSDDVSLRVRVSVADKSKRDKFRLRWDAADAVPLEVYAPAGQSRTVRMPKQPDGAPALRLSGDDTEFDNTLHVLPPQVAPLPVLFLGEDGDEDPRGSLYYVRRAFPQGTRVEIVTHRGAEAAPAFQLAQAQLLILGDGVADPALASAREFGRAGHIVVAPLTSAASAQMLSRLVEVPQLTATEAAVKNYGLLAQIDFQHPVFAPFADPRFSDFTKINFWKWRRLELSGLPDAHILARFDSGDPAIVQVPLGKGSVVVFTSSWRPADSQLALSSKFVPLLHGLLEQSSNVPLQKAQYFVGEEIVLGADARAVRKPDGTEAALTGARFADTDQPGIYAVIPGARHFAVNLAPEESRTSPLEMERFKSLGIPLAETAARTASVARAEARGEAAALEQRQRLWRWMLVAAIGVLLLETMIAGRLSRFARTTTVAPA